MTDLLVGDDRIMEGQSITKHTVKTYFDKWQKRLGLGWWDIDIAWVETEKEIAAHFDDSDTSAFVNIDWPRGDAILYIRVPHFKYMAEDRVEKIVLHELCHILVNEMREGEMHHEERVVTGLTKAFLWTEEMCRGE